MKHTHAYIVEPTNGRYNNKKNVEGQELILNTSIEDHKFVNRLGVIVETPIIKDEYDLQIGDEVIIHHNVFRRYYDVRGNEKNSRNYFEEDKYFCFSDQIFLYKRKDKWIAPKGYCFVIPLKATDQFNTKSEKPLQGIVKYSDGTVEVGDLVGYRPSSEYEFIVDGERLFRVLSNFITIKYEHQGNEETYNPSWAQSS